jgi:type IV pilus assembly protein PilA
MLRKIRESQQEEGFTLIELLVVVIIIGILAAIAIPVFLAQRERAWRSASQSDLRNAAVSFETYFTDNGFYDIDALDSAFGFNATVTVENNAATGETATSGDQAWCMVASHQNHQEVWALGSGGSLTLVVDGEGAAVGTVADEAACPNVAVPAI